MIKERYQSILLVKTPHRVLARPFHVPAVMPLHINQLTERIIGGAIEVHEALGPGLLESPYEHCLAIALVEAGLTVERQKPVPLAYGSTQIDCAYRLDLLVNDLVIVEVKSVTRLTELHRAQMLSYLRLMDRQLGLVLNFNVKVLSAGGIMGVVNGLKED